MQDERPFGWRPYSDERRAALREGGFDEAAIESMEASNVYSPVENAVAAYEMASAILFALTKRLGADFAHDVRSEMDRRATAAEKSDNVEDRVEARVIRSFVDEGNWDRLIARASTGGG